MSLTFTLRPALALALAVGCQRNDSPPHASPPPAVVHDASAGDRLDVNGISVRFLDGGSIEISGRDRWGNALDTTYENRQFLRDALPVLERSLTSEQAAGLRARLDSTH